MFTFDLLNKQIYKLQNFNLMRPPLGFPIFEGYERVEIATAAILAIYISLIILQVILEFKRNK